MSVLIATAFDEGLVPLARLACALVPGASIDLVHVVPTDATDTERALAKEALAVQAAVLAGVAHHVSPLLYVGDPAAAIAVAIAERQPELIALGGARPSTELGVVAQAVVAEAQVPVLAARGLPDDPPWPLHIAVGVDLTPASGPALGWAERIDGATITLMHAWSPAVQAERLGVVIDPEAPPEEVTHALARDVRAAVHRPQAEVDLVAVAPGDSVPHALLRRAVELDADLVVLGTHATGFGASLTGMLGAAVREAPLPVVAVPDHAWQRIVPEIKKVLVPVDFTAASTGAVPYGFALAGPDGEVHLAHVSMRRFHPDRAERRAAEVRIRLTSLIPNAARLAGTHVHVHALEDVDAVARIAALADELAVDAIAVGAVPHGPLWGLAAGSFVQDLTARTHRPVLVVRPQRS